LNLAGRVGLWLTGAIDHFSVRTINDEVCWNRYWEWEFPITGHPFLRQAVAHAAMGGDFFELNSETLDWTVNRRENPWTFSPMGKESTEMVLHMLGKGILIPPTRDEVAGVSPVALCIREPHDRFLRDAFAFHDFRTNEPDAILDVAPLGHLGCYWGMSPTPESNLASYCYNKRYQYGNFIPATPFGFAAVIPWHGGDPAFFKKRVTTDGVYFRDGAKRSGAAARSRVISALRDGAAKLPFRVEGDVFLQVQRFNPRHYRLYAVDPGFLDPADRDVKVHIQLKGTVQSVRDLINNKRLETRRKVLNLKIPAGAFRITDVKMNTAD